MEIDIKSQEIRILGLLITDRKQEAGRVQHFLTRYGCTVKTRLGITIEQLKIESGGLILLELCGNITEMDNLEKELIALEGVQVNKMIF